MLLQQVENAVLKTITNLSVGPQCFTISWCHQWDKDLTVADCKVQGVLPVYTNLYLMNILQCK